MLNDCGLATVLAALRHWQRQMFPLGAQAAVEYPQLTDAEPLTAEQIDQLCERLNLGSAQSDLVTLCRKVAETAENWGDCSDLREVVSVFRELGVECRMLLEKPHELARSRPAGYLLYDCDAQVLISTKVYATYSEALDVADRLRDVIVVPLGLEVDEDADAELCECELPGVFYSGVPGIIARVVNGRLDAGAVVERCDLCGRYESDEQALEKLREMGIA